MSTFKGWRCNVCGAETRYSHGSQPADAAAPGWVRIEHGDGYHTKSTFDLCSAQCVRAWITAREGQVEAAVRHAAAALRRLGT